MTTRITADFAIVSWHEEIYDQPEEGSTLLQATIQKSYQGAVEGTSVARLLMVRAGDEGGEGYLGSERVTARLGERAGTFVIQHGGIASGDELFSFGHVVKDSGTGDLAGMSGTCAFRHDEQGAVFTLDYDLGP
ncbi:MAG: DUF3224 domain-containing protein [Chloroflexia bacterium]|nr:DUF3224 domain-containing protein [Chloroflexia bacterium]